MDRAAVGERERSGAICAHVHPIGCIKGAAGTIDSDSTVAAAEEADIAVGGDDGTAACDRERSGAIGAHVQKIGSSKGTAGTTDGDIANAAAGQAEVAVRGNDGTAACDRERARAPDYTELNRASARIIPCAACAGDCDCAHTARPNAYLNALGGC